MPPPTPLKISTAALTRLLKEQLSYETELREQEAALERLKGKAKAKAKAAGARVDGEDDRDEGDGNEEFVLRQQVCVVTLSLCYVILCCVLLYHTILWCVLLHRM